MLDAKHKGCGSMSHKLTLWRCYFNQELYLLGYLDQHLVLNNARFVQIRSTGLSRVLLIEVH